MIQIRKNDRYHYYSNAWENNGFTICELSDNCFLVFAPDDGVNIVKRCDSLKEAEDYTSNVKIEEAQD